MFKVDKIRNVDWGAKSIVRATLDLIIIPHGIVLKDCMLKEGQYGFFVTSPSMKLKNPWTDDSGKTHEYKDLAFFPKEIRDELAKTVMEAYDPTGKTHTTTKTLQDLEEEVPF